MDMVFKNIRLGIVALFSHFLTAINNDVNAMDFLVVNSLLTDATQRYIQNQSGPGHTQINTGMAKITASSLTEELPLEKIETKKGVAAVLSQDKSFDSTNEKAKLRVRLKDSCQRSKSPLVLFCGCNVRQSYGKIKTKKYLAVKADGLIQSVNEIARRNADSYLCHDAQPRDNVKDHDRRFPSFPVNENTEPCLVKGIRSLSSGSVM